MKIHRNLIKRLVESDFLKHINDNAYFVADNSGFSQWVSCHTKGFINTGLRRIPSHGQTPLIFGSATHEGLAHRLRGNSNQQSIEVAVAYADKHRLDDYLDPKRNRTVLVDMLTSYFINCECTDTWIRPVVADGEPIVEKGFEFELGVMQTQFKFLPKTITFAWKGKLDVLGRDQGDLWVFDHKTTSVMGEKFVDDKLRGSQMLGYTWAGNRFAAVFGEKLRGVIINALASRSKGYEFKMFHIPYTEQAVNDWASETLRSMYETLAYVDSMLVWYHDSSDEYFEMTPNRDACVSKYGRCQYFDACNSVPIMLERILFDDAQFIHNDWDPLSE